MSTLASSPLLSSSLSDFLPDFHIYTYIVRFDIDVSRHIPSQTLEPNSFHFKDIIKEKLGPHKI